MKLKGFVKYKIDYVIKFGGSLLDDEEACQNAIKGLEELANTKKRILIIPGGGPTDNTIEKLDKKHPFASDTHHRACARAQDQTGLMICDPVWSNYLIACETLEEVRHVLDKNKVAVLLPSKIMFDIDPFERIWEISSDAMSVWFAWLVNTKNVIVLTNVDGIFDKEHIGNTNYLMEKITATNLMKYGHTAVDECTPDFLKEKGIDCWVINGRYPERMLDIINKNKVIGTLIKGE